MSLLHSAVDGALKFGSSSQGFGAEWRQGREGGRGERGGDGSGIFSGQVE